MTFQEAIDFMDNLFKTTWTGLGFDINNVKWDDVPGQKPTGEVTWARVIVRHASGNQSTLSSGTGIRRFRRTGLFMAQIFTPIGDGSVAEYSVSQSVVNAYQSAQNDNLWFRNVQMREVGSADGAFAQTNVLADFIYDDVR